MPFMCNVGPTSYLQDSLLFGLQRVLKLDIFCENLWAFNLKLIRPNERNVCFFASFVLFKRLEALSPQMDCYFAEILMPLWVVGSASVTFLSEQKLFMLRVY